MEGIVVKEVSKFYVKPVSLRDLFTFFRHRQKIWAVRGVSFQVAPKEIVGIVGPNGAGKTTLLKVISGLLLANSGEVLVCGIPAQRAKHLVGYCISEARSFFLRLSGIENLRFFSALYGLSFKEAHQRIAWLIETLALDGVAKRQVMSYSEGMKQRLAIARALLHNPRVLLLDEISRGLDPAMRIRLYDLIRGLAKKEGVAVLIASHNLEEIRDLTDRVYLMKDGVFAGAGTYKELEPLITQTFLGESCLSHS